MTHASPNEPAASNSQPANSQPAGEMSQSESGNEKVTGDEVHASDTGSGSEEASPVTLPATNSTSENRTEESATEPGTEPATDSAVNSSPEPAATSESAASPTETPETPEASAPVTAGAAAVDTDTNPALSGTDDPAPVEATADSGNRPKIKIGSQRNPDQDEQRVPKAVKDAKEKQLDIGGQAEAAVPAEIGPSVEDLGNQWEQEAEAVLQGQSVSDLMASATEGADVELEVNARIKGTVTKIDGDLVFFLLKGQYDGVVPVKQFKKEPEPGTMTDVVVTGFNSDDNLYELSLPGAAVAVGDWTDLEVGKLIEVRITGSNTGGLECTVNNIRGFIPASQIDVSRVDNLGAFVNQTMECVITEANRKKKNLVLSRRQILEKELKERKKEILEGFEVGSTIEGKITKLRDFGAFVNIGQGVEGLVHISKCSWHHIKHPSEVFTEGQDVTVRIEKINKETGKIQLSHRDTVEHPWKRVSEKYPVDSTVNGTVSKIADFGAFIKLETGIEGLVHISEIAHERVKSVGAVLSEGQDVEVKILSVDPDKQKMSLSIKALLPVPAREPAAEQSAESKEPPREMAVKKRNKPLKGGTSESAGGNQFGLKW